MDSLKIVKMVAGFALLVTYALRIFGVDVPTIVDEMAGILGGGAFLAAANDHNTAK